MECAYVFMNRNYFRRAGGLTLWSLDPNYCRVRVTVKMKRKLSAALCISAELSAASDAPVAANVAWVKPTALAGAIFDHSRHQSLKRVIPLSTLRDAVLSSREMQHSQHQQQRTRVHCLTLRQMNPLSGSTVNMYHESRLDIDKIFSCLAAVRRPLCVFLDLLDKQPAATVSAGGGNSWIVRLLNNLTVQALGLCPDYLYVLCVGTSAFELQDVNQASILTCKLESVASFGCLNGWFFLQYASGGCRQRLDGDVSRDFDNSGYLALQCGRTGQLRGLFQQLLGGSRSRRWPSAPCLGRRGCSGAEEAAAVADGRRSPKRESSFNTHRPRSPAPVVPASPRKFSSGSFGHRFSFFRRHQQQQQQQQQAAGQWLHSQNPGIHKSTSSVTSGSGSSGCGCGSGNCSCSSSDTSSLSASSVASLSQLDAKPSRRRSLIGGGGGSIRRASSRSLRNRREKFEAMLDGAC